MADAPPAVPDADLPAEWEYELREPDGRLVGLVHVHQLVERLYAGSLDAGWQVRRPPPGPAWPGRPEDAGPWQPLWEVPELAAVFDLLDLRRSVREGEARISRWQKSEFVEDDDEALQPSVTQTLPSLPTTTPAPAERSALLPVLVGTVALLVLLLVVGLVLSM